jgi:MSHA pilin protein MshC
MVFGGGYNKSHTGFTVIELIVVITLIGILAVTAGPKLLAKSEFTAVATTNQYIAHLRLVQLKALNQRGVCHNSAFEIVGGETVFGIPNNVDATCGTTTATDSRNVVDGSVITLIDGTKMTQIDGTVDPNPKVSPQIVFDGNGIPTDGGHCAGACKFKIVSGDTVYLCIESQGYIHQVSSTYANCN